MLIFYARPKLQPLLHLYHLLTNPAGTLPEFYGN